jgi:hypothetical protein
MGSLAGAAHLLDYNADVLRWAQRERKSRVEHKGKSPPDNFLRGKWVRNQGLKIPQRRAHRAGGDRKVTTGITGLWRPSVHSDVAF